MDRVNGKRGVTKPLILLDRRLQLALIPAVATPVSRPFPLSQKHGDASHQFLLDGEPRSAIFY